MYFAAHGYPFLIVDVRGRGNSEGVFKPNINEARDGHDVVEWLAQQPYCNTQVAMWGGSYAGINQWSTAKEFPPHLATIVPVAAPYFAVDFPIRGNIAPSYLMQWLTLVWGRTSQDKLFWNNDRYWRTKFLRWFESGLPFRQLDTMLGCPSETFQEWLAHPMQDAYWDNHNPTSEHYARLSIPVLTITGSYDGDQLGALRHYAEHLKHNPKVGRGGHYLVIGPWDHAGTRTPQPEFGGLKFGPTSLVDLGKLHLQWYAWTMQGGPKPEFLKNNVLYYVMGAEKWRDADTLEAITARIEPLYLHSTGNATDVYHSGSLGAKPPAESEPDNYVYDPHEIGHARLESTVDPADLTDQRMVHALVGRQLVYHSEPIAEDTEISGFFKLTAWLSINQPDTDFRVWVYEIGLDGGSILLSMDTIRARYRESLREERLLRTIDPQRYDFECFMFVSRVVRKGHRLRLVIGPVNSLWFQKNYNSGGAVCDESMQDARTVTVKLFHDEAHPSVLYVPIGQPEL
jgi:hypothetical protein